MCDITTSNIFNEVDEKNVKLYIEWTDLQFSIILLRHKMAPMCGKMTIDDTNYFAKALSKSANEYLQETRNALCGNDLEIQFFLRDTTFEWKRNKVWTLGKIVVHPITDVMYISEKLQCLLDKHQKIQQELYQLRKENDRLKQIETTLSKDLEGMIKIKTVMEKDLYKKFLLILNAKKKRIRELQDSLKNYTNVGKSVFEESTDPSGDSDEELHKSCQLDVKQLKSDKRKIYSEEVHQNGYKVKKQDKAVSKSCMETKKSPQPSTSKSTTEDVENSSASSVETECDIELKDSDDLVTAKSKSSRLSFVEEESDDDLFSQSQ